MLDLTDDNGLDVEFMNLVVDKADNLRVIDSDSHFSDFTGVHPSKIKQGKLFLHNVIKPIYREKIMKILCKKNSPFVYFNAEFIDKDGNDVYIYCTAQNYENSTYCRMTLADVSKSRIKQEKLKQQARDMTHLIDMVTGGVTLFKVTDDMHIKTIYLNEGACRLFGVSKAAFREQNFLMDEMIHPSDKSAVYQAIGKAMATNDPIDIEFRLKSFTGGFIWCKFNAAIQSYDSDGNPIFHAMYTDITNIKEAEEKADNLYENQIEIFKNIPTPIFSVSTEAPLILNIVSEDFVKFLGVSRSFLFETHGGRLSDFMLENEVKYVEDKIKEQLKSDGAVRVKYSLKTKSSGYVAVNDYRKIINQEDGTKSMLCSIRKAADSFILPNDIY